MRYLLPSCALVGGLAALAAVCGPEVAVINKQRVGHWAVYIAGVDTLLAQEDTEGEALAAALLAVWGQAA